MPPDPSSTSSSSSHIISSSSPVAVDDVLSSPIVPSGDSRFELSGTTAVAPVASAAANSATHPRDAAGLGSAGNDIEMEPIPGHRRRKSSLMNPVGGHSHPSVPLPGRPSYSQNSRAQGTAASSSLVEDAKEHLDIPGRSAGDSGGSSSRDDSSRDSFSDEDLHDDEEMGLTRKDKSRKQKKRRRNTLLDNRIAREKNLSDDERKEADRNVVKSLFVNGVLILLWYFFSLSISLVSAPTYISKSGDFVIIFFLMF